MNETAHKLDFRFLDGSLDGVPCGVDGAVLYSSAGVPSAAAPGVLPFAVPEGVLFGVANASSFAAEDCLTGVLLGVPVAVPAESFEAASGFLVSTGTGLPEAG